MPTTYRPRLSALSPPPPLTQPPLTSILLPYRRHSISTTFSKPPMSPSTTNPLDPWSDSLSAHPALSPRLHALNTPYFIPISKRLSDTSQSQDGSPHPLLSNPRPSVDLTLSPLSSEYDPGSPRRSSAGSNDAIPSSRSLYDSLRPDRVRTPVADPAATPVVLTKSVSARALGMPTGKVECLPFERPPTPVRLPRPRVFIKPSSMRSSGSIDFGDRLGRIGDGDGDAQGRQLIRHFEGEEAHKEGRRMLLREERGVFFSEEEEEESEESEEDRIAMERTKRERNVVAGGGVLTNKVHRVLSSLRSISFQNAVMEDLDTAWGQAVVDEYGSGGRRRNEVPSALRWRRPRGRISSKNGVQEFNVHECCSEADAESVISYGGGGRHNTRGHGGRNMARGFGGRKVVKKSVWGRRDRHSVPFANQYIVTDGAQGYLAAASSLNETMHPVRAVVPADRDSLDRRRGSVDKYVEFIHASAQRESRCRLLGKNLPGRVISRAQAMFRRKWK